MKAAVKTEDGPMHPVVLGLFGCRKGLSVQQHSLLNLGQCSTACPEGKVFGVAGTPAVCPPFSKLIPSHIAIALQGLEEVFYSQGRASRHIEGRLKEVAPQEQRDAEEMMPAAPSLQGVLASLARQASGLPSGT